jgi:hypothetical protein
MLKSSNTSAFSSSKANISTFRRQGRIKLAHMCSSLRRQRRLTTARQPPGLLRKGGSATRSSSAKTFGRKSNFKISLPRAKSTKSPVQKGGKVHRLRLQFSEPCHCSDRNHACECDDDVVFEGDRTPRFSELQSHIVPAHVGRYNARLCCLAPGGVCRKWTRQQ